MLAAGGASPGSLWRADAERRRVESQGRRRRPIRCVLLRMTRVFLCTVCPPSWLLLFSFIPTAAAVGWRPAHVCFCEGAVVPLPYCQASVPDTHDSSFLLSQYAGACYPGVFHVS